MMQEKETMGTLCNRVSMWGLTKGLHDKDKALGQLAKTMEELGETASAVVKGNKEAIKDGIGDTTVCLIQLAAQHGMTLEECLLAAWNEIKDRKGRLNENGVFVKEN